jgi:hypothetical protein
MKVVFPIPPSARRIPPGSSAALQEPIRLSFPRLLDVLTNRPFESIQILLPVR